MGPDDLLRSGELPEEEITRAENRWVLVVCAITVLLVATYAVSAALFHDALPSSVETIQSDQIHRSGEFVESNVGTAMQPDGSAVVRLVLQQFSFSPSIIRVPVNTPVVIRAVSADVVHGFLLEGTNVNAMVVPGYVTTVRVRFNHPGEYLVPCHEYCGMGHQDMWATLVVGSKADFPVDPTGKTRF
jgi:cytochrome c oxidase subunit 2